MGWVISWKFKMSAGIINIIPKRRLLRSTRLSNAVPSTLNRRRLLRVRTTAHLRRPMLQFDFFTRRSESARVVNPRLPNDEGHLIRSRD